MSNPNLKNFTTSISASQSISEIERFLLNFGARRFMKNTDDNKQISEIMFTLKIGGNETPFKLPANVEKVAQYLANEYNRTHSRKTKSKEDFLDQASRVAWRIIKDWVHAQLSIIATGMVTIEQVFLPYVYDHQTGSTLAEKVLNGKMKNLLPLFQSDVD